MGELTPIEAVARAIAPNITGADFDKLPENSGDLKVKWTSGEVEDIYLTTQADILAASHDVLKALSNNITPKMVSAANLVPWTDIHEDTDVARVMEAALKVALAAAMEE